MKVVDDLLLCDLALRFGGLGEMKAVSAMHDVSEVDRRSKLTSTVDLCELSLLADSKSVDVDL